MGLSLSVVVAVCLLMPGAVFVFGLSRMNPSRVPGISLDQHLSFSLALMVMLSLLLHAIWLLVWRTLASYLAWPAPDAAQALALLGGGLSSAATERAFDSLARYPGRIGAYFVALPVLALSLAKWVNRRLQHQPAANWLELLRPADALFVWITAALHLNGRCYLCTGPVHQFSVSREGHLERVVLGGATCRVLVEDASAGFGRTATHPPRRETSDATTVLLLKDVQVVSLSYLYGSRAGKLPSAGRRRKRR